MAVPYTFAGATSSIPLSQLDTNFASTITLGNTAIQLGNTVTTLNNMTLANVTISSGNVTITNVTVTTANVTVGNITTLTGTSATYTNITSGNVTITGGTLNNVAIGGTTAASGAFTTLSGNGAFSLTGDQVQISEGGTGQTTANAAFNALAPSQTSNSGKYLKTDGANTSWDAIDINTADITGTLPILNGGTGQTTANAAFNALAPSQTSQSGKYLKTDGTNASWDALDISTADITGTLPVANGGTNATATPTAGAVAYGTGTAYAFTSAGSSGQVLTSGGAGAPTWSSLSSIGVTTFSAGTTGFTPSTATSGAVTLAGTLATTNGGTGLTSFTSNRVFYASSTSAIGQSANLTFDGTTLTANALTTTSTVTINGGTANGVAYLNGSKVLTTGSALTYNGSVLGVADGSITAGNTAVVLTGKYSSGFPTTGAGYFQLQTNNVDGTTGGLTVLTNSAGTLRQSYRIHEDTTAAACYQSWNVGGSEQARLTSTGLGIGTSSPSSRLVVSQGSGAFQAVQIVSSNPAEDAGLRFQGGGGNAFRIQQPSGARGLFFYDETATTTRMTIDASGNVGIGTSSPLARLTVSDSSNPNSGTMTLGNNASFNGTLQYLIGPGELRISQVGSSSLGTTFYTNGAERMRLDASGNLGIGTSSPGGFYGKLTVAGGIRTLDDNSSKLELGRYSAGVPNSYIKLGTNSNSLRFTNAADIADLLELTNSGNLGLGVTPSAWSTGKAFEVGAAGTAIWSNSSVDSYYTQGAFFNAGWKYSHTGATGVSTYQQSQGTHRWSTAAGGTAGNAISFTQAMTLDASGNLLTGLTSPLYGTTNRVQISANGSATAIMSVSHGGLASQSGYMFWDGTNLQVANNSASGALIFGTNVGTERARITSGGDLVVGNTSAIGGAKSSVLQTGGTLSACYYAWNNATTGDNYFIGFGTEGSVTTRGSIDYNRAGGLVRYNTTSDYRAKDIIGPVQNTGTTIDALKVYEGVMKGATQARPMMIAHEAQEVVPFCVSGAKDETNEDGTPKYQQMDHASLVPLLIAELQSLRARVAQLEAK